MEFLLKACSVGFLLSVMIGPVFFILLETSIRRGFREALIFDLGVLASDALYILLAYLFYAEVDKMSTGTNKAVFGFIGGGIFIIYGVVNFFKKLKIRTESSLENIEHQKLDFVRTFLKGFLLNFANPLVLFYWFSVLTLANQSISDDASDFMLFLFLIIVLLTFLGFDLLKILGAKQLKPLVTDRVLIGLNRLIGLVFFLFGVVLLFQNYFRIYPL
jgi:threonine/homoserine/homoserine lactone efflux protein